MLVSRSLANQIVGEIAERTPSEAVQLGGVLYNVYRLPEDEWEALLGLDGIAEIGGYYKAWYTAEIANRPTLWVVA